LTVNKCVLIICNMKKIKAAGRGKKPTNLEADSSYVPVKVNKNVISRMRIIAATRGISFAEMSRELLSLGLESYLKDGHLDLSALEAIETSASMNAMREVAK